MDLGLEGKVALVTAASRGLGKAAAVALSSAGAKLSICSRTPAIDSTAKEIRRATGGEAIAVRADLTKPDEVVSLVDQTVAHYGHIDVLIINSGGPPPGDFLSLSPNDWLEAIDLVLMSVVRLCYGVVPHMLERGSGSIVTNQSITVKHPLESLILSNSLRLAVIGLMKSLADELGPKGIRVNSINPAWTRTERVDSLLADRAGRRGTSIEEEAERVTAGIPLGRMGTVEEYGRAIAWLASPAASFVHGHALMFDGGAARPYL
jgi:3-oxoacyl-[acyl-carrier protein] reductase